MSLKENLFNEFLSRNPSKDEKLLSLKLEKMSKRFQSSLNDEQKILFSEIEILMSDLSALSQKELINFLFEMLKELIRF